MIDAFSPRLDDDQTPRRRVMIIHEGARAAVRRLAWTSGVPGFSRLVDGASRLLAVTGEVQVESYGCRFVTDLRDHIEAGIFWERYENHLLDRWKSLVRPGGVVMDVGANVGLYAL